MTISKRLIATTLIVSCTTMTLPQRTHAAIVPTEAVLAHTSAQSQANRAKVSTFLARADVHAALVGHGLDAQNAIDRVAAMTDTEVDQLAGRIDQAPAGGDILGLIFTVFIILLVTDILGLTKVFPFTRSVR